MLKQFADFIQKIKTVVLKNKQNASDTDFNLIKVKLSYYGCILSPHLP